ncbi:MAG: preprotein translocase subunit YajC [Paraprevotella sp.]|nr:preprotein translocase subunit YajC [Paraprevotella sp.]
MNFLTVLLQAQQGGGMSMIIMMVVIFAIMYFFMIRPQNKKQKEIQNFRNSITVGTDIVTAGGIYGKVKEVNDMDNTLMVEVANGVKIKVAKNSVYASVPVDLATGK